MTLRRLLAPALLAVFTACPGPAPVADPCAPSPCTLGDRTVCTVVDSAARCSCREGYDDVAGACVRPGACAATPCTREHRAVCVEVAGTAECRCDVGYRDDGAGACVATASCTPNPCTQPNRTVCEEGGGAVTCGCVPGTRDDGSGGCVSTNPCAGDPCTQPNRTVCVASGATAICQCESGYRDDGSGACVKTTSCTPNPCTQANRGVCTEANGAVTCGCDPGYRLDAAGQCVPLVACTPNPCAQPNRGVCSDVGGTAVCACDPGYEDRGGACVQSDLCSPNPCTQPNQGVCVAGADAGVACECDVGYQPGSAGCVLIPAPTCANQHTTGDSYEPDECPALAKDIVDGVPQAHTIDPVGDVDWVKFTVDAGAVVRVEETGPLATTVALYAPDGTTAIASNAADRLVRKLPAAGTHYFQVRATSSSATGATTLLYTHLGYDDYGDTNATATPVGLGSLTGRFDFPGDWDVLAVPVQAGRVYRFEETTSADVYVYLASATSTLVATRDAPESILFKAAATETLFFGVRLFSSTALGTWAATLTDLGTDDQADGRTGANTLAPAATPGTSLTGAFEYPMDWDCLAVPVTAGRVYRFEETTSFDVYTNVLTPTGTLFATNDAESALFKAATTETLTFCIRPFSNSLTGAWGMRVTDLGTDDQADGRTGANTLAPAAAPGASLTGAFEYPMDWDCLAVPVAAGRVYRFEETTSVDVYTNVLTPTGTLSAVSDAEGVTFRAATSETLTFCIRPFSNTLTGAWAMRVTDLGTDDHGDTRAEATPLTVGAAAVDGVIQFPDDADVFSFDATAGSLAFQVITTGVATSVQVQTSTGSQVAADSGPGTLTFSVPSAGTYFVRVTGRSGALGSYTVRVSN